MNVFLRKAANFFNFPGPDGAASTGAGGASTGAGAASTGAGGASTGAGCIDCGGNIIGRCGSGAGFKDGSNLYLYSFNFLEEIRSK